MIYDNCQQMPDFDSCQFILIRTAYIADRLVSICARSNATFDISLYEVDVRSAFGRRLRHNQIFSDGWFTKFSYPWCSAALASRARELYYHVGGEKRMFTIQRSFVQQEKPSEDQLSLRGRRWKGKGKGKGILVAKETRGLREEGTGGKHVLKTDQSGFSHQSGRCLPPFFSRLKSPFPSPFNACQHAQAKINLKLRQTHINAYKAHVLKQTYCRTSYTLNFVNRSFLNRSDVQTRSY